MSYKSRLKTFRIHYSKLHIVTSAVLDGGNADNDSGILGQEILVRTSKSFENSLSTAFVQIVHVLEQRFVRDETIPDPVTLLEEEDPNCVKFLSLM